MRLRQNAMSILVGALKQSWRNNT